MGELVGEVEAWISTFPALEKPTCLVKTMMSERER
jgi:hypothetical protein